MTAGLRRSRARELCVHLTEQIANIAPPGIGNWGGAWGIVGDADAEFMVALFEWERTGDDAVQIRVREGYDRVLDAWREASRQYERETA